MFWKRWPEETGDQELGQELLHLGKQSWLGGHWHSPWQMGLNPVMLCLETHTTAVAKSSCKPSAYTCRNIVFLCSEPKSLCVSRGSSQPSELRISRWKSRLRREKYLHPHHPLLGSHSPATPHCATLQRDRRKIYTLSRWSRLPVQTKMLPNSRLHACLWLWPRLPLNSIHVIFPRKWVVLG